MAINSESIKDICNLLTIFNEGYLKRDLNALDRFMSLFAEDEKLEFLATGGTSPKRGTWRVGKEAVRDLVRSDWEYWGLINIDSEKVNIGIHNDVAWLSAPATVTTDDETEEFLGDKEDAFGVVHNVTNRTSRVKPLRMTAVLVKREERWQFIQIHLSFSIRSLPK